jgi:uncharacterized cupin superfamily protein
MTAQSSTEQGKWFTVNCDDAPWEGSAGHAYVHLAALAGEGSFRQYGISVDVLDPAAGNSYHREAFEDESFLVLDGEFDLVIEGELHRIHAGQFVHCPAGTAHLFVGAGDRPASIMMLGRRGMVPEGAEWGEYLPDPHAARFGLCVDEVTSDPSIAYGGRPAYGPVEPPQPFRVDLAPREPASTSRGEPGWFIVDLHAPEAWLDNGLTSRFLPDGLGAFPQYGINVQVMRPGQPNCRYHREFTCDETMLVLDGEAIVIAEGEERAVRAGDFVHVPAGVAHVMVGAGDAQCAVLMVGTRDDTSDDATAWGEYVPDPVAARHGAAVAAQTHDPGVAYAERPAFVPTSTPPWTWHTR